MRAAAVGALALCAIAGIAFFGCESSKRKLLAEKCEARVQPYIQWINLMSKVPEADKKVCGCIAERIDIAKVQEVALKPEAERSAAVKTLLAENLPLIQTCLQDTGVLPDLSRTKK
jgi:hypothetical protein